MFWVQLIMSVFLITLGILGLQGEPYSLPRSRALFRDETLRAVAAAIELVGGGIFLIVLFVPMNRRFLFIVGLVVFANWLLLILDILFLSGFLEPDLLAWLNHLSWYLIPAAALWLITRQFR
jgi:hypothetical protein